MGRSIFLTGFPGFIAGHLVDRMLREEGTTVRLLHIPAMAEAAERALQRHQGAAGRLELVAGDITRPDLGLAPDILAAIRAEVDYVYHLAAIYDLSAGEEVSRLVNVRGTEHVLDFCERLPNLKRLVHFSTAYVSGTRRGVATEDELEQTSGWKNFYEQTKWESEVAVRARWDRVPTIIIRPGVVVGDSKTGEINKYDGPYFAIRLMVKAESVGKIGRARALWVGGKKDAFFYLVPVDFLCDATEYIVHEEGTTGRAYHVLPGDSITMKGTFRQLFKIFDLSPPLLKFPPWVGRTLLSLFPSLGEKFQFPRQLLDYMGHDVVYDTKNLDAALEGSGLSCPRAEDFLPVMVDYVRQHPEIPPNFGLHASGRREVATTLNNPPAAGESANPPEPAPLTGAAPSSPTEEPPPSPSRSEIDA